MTHRAKPFDRYSMWFGCTRAYHRFQKHQTEINDLYWSFAPVAGFADYLARHSVPGTNTASLFHAPGPDIHRLAPTPERWRSHFKQFQNWTRLAAVLSAVSYLEIYLQGVITIALRSDPLVRFGRPRLMDGVTWLKQGMRDDIRPLVKACVEGQWQKRTEGYRSIFSSIPPLISANIGELETIRTVRNSVGHAFGRNLSTTHDPLHFDAGASERLSEARFKRWLGLVDEVARAVDRHLGPSHIGEFEALSMYHHWRDQPRFGRERSYSEERAFARELTRHFGHGPGQEFCRELIRHYNNA